MAEEIESPEAQNPNVNNKFGLILISHDAIDLGVTEEVVARMGGGHAGADSLPARLIESWKRKG